MNKMYGFDGEVKAKYNVKLADLFQEVFQYLPLVCVHKESIVSIPLSQNRRLLGNHHRDASSTRRFS